MKRISLFNISKLPRLSIPALTGLMFIFLLFGCDDTPTEVENYNPEPVLHAFLVNGQPVKEAFLERVAPLEGLYYPTDHGIVGATMHIFDVDGGDSLTMVDDPNEPGRYIPEAGDSLIPQSLITYGIEITTLQGESLSAETTIPGTMTQNGPVEVFQDYPDSIHVLKNDTTITDSTAWDTTRVEVVDRNMPNMVWRWDGVDGAMGYQGFSLALTERDLLVPLDPGWDPNDEDDEIEDIDRGRFGYALVRYDQRRVDLFWLAFWWEGPYRVELRALSQGYYDYLFSSFRVDQGLINRPNSNVQGGLGIFGSLSKHVIYVYVKKVGT